MEPAHEGRMRRLLMRGAWIACAVVVVACGALGWRGFWVEPSLLVVREHALSPRRWPEALDGLRVALLADLHTGSPGNRLDKLPRIVAATNAARPDLILLLGDYVIHGVPGGRFVPPEKIAGELANLRAPLGVFAVLGNHDWWLGARRVRAALEDAGIPVLDDRALPLPWRGSTFYLGGISDFREGIHDVRGVLATVPDGAPLVLFTHNPDVFPEIPERVAVTFGAHTHGGQVDLPLIGAPIVPSEYGSRYVSGAIEEDGKLFFVSPGLGTSILPVRLGVPPEISLVTLRARR